MRAKTDKEIIQDLAREIEGLPRPVQTDDIETVLWAAYGLGAGRLASSEKVPPRDFQEMFRAIVHGRPALRVVDRPVDTSRATTNLTVGPTDPDADY